MHLNEVNGNIIMDREAMEVLDKRAMEKWQNMKKLPWRGVNYDSDPHNDSQEPFYRCLPGFRYEGGKGDDRVKSAGQFAVGMVGGAYGYDSHEHCCEALACLYDHKGHLIVVIKHDSEKWNPVWEHCFRAAWSCHGESGDQVEFLKESSDDWQRVWSSRRF